MDSGELNKFAGAAIGALLLFLLLGFFSELIYYGAPHEDTEDRVLAFAVEVEDAGATGGEEEVIDFGALLAAADPAEGESVFNKCKACHNLVEGENAVGPHLYGVYGRDIASVEGFDYSPALADKEGVWELEGLFHFIHNPSGWAPGTKMGFAGLPDDQDKVDLIVFLNQQGDAPAEIVPPAMPEGAEAAVEEEAVEDEGAVAAAAGEAPQEELLETAEDEGLETTEERDAEDRGVLVDAEHTGEVELKSEEEAEAKIGEAAEEGIDDQSATYSEQESGTDEVQPEFEAEGEAATGEAEPGEQAAEAAVDEAESEAATGEEAEAAATEAEPGEEAEAVAEETEPDVAEAAPGSEAMASPEEVVDEEVETDAPVVTNPTTGSTIITEEDRTEPLPLAEEAEGAVTEEIGADVEGAEAEAAEPAAEDDTAAEGGEFAPLLAAADAAAGEKVFRKCQACHRLEDGKNAVGPHLHGIVGRDIASVENYSYSEALAAKEGAWDLATLDAFLTNPKGWAPGTKMAFAGLKDAQDRIDVITYLNEASGAPVDLGSAGAGGQRTAEAVPPAVIGETDAVAGMAVDAPDLARPGADAEAAGDAAWATGDGDRAATALSAAEAALARAAELAGMAERLAATTLAQVEVAEERAEEIALSPPASPVGPEAVDLAVVTVPVAVPAYGAVGGSAGATERAIMRTAEAAEALAAAIDAATGELAGRRSVGSAD